MLKDLLVGKMIVTHRRGGNVPTNVFGGGGKIGTPIGSARSRPSYRCWPWTRSVIKVVQEKP